MSALESALSAYNSLLTNVQNSAAFSIDDAKTAALEQAKNAAVQIADTKKIDDTMILHHFGPKIAEYLQKALELGKDINKVAKNPSKVANDDEVEKQAKSAAEDEPQEIEMQNMADIPPRDPADPTPPPETADPDATGAPTPQTDDVEEDVEPSVEPDAASAAEDASAPPTGMGGYSDVGAIPASDAEGQQLVDDLEDHFAGSREFDLADKVADGTAEPSEIINKLNEQQNDLFDDNQPDGTSVNARNLTGRIKEYNNRQPSEETTEQPAQPEVDDDAPAVDTEPAAATAEASAVPTGIGGVSNVGDIPDTDAEGQQLLDDLEDHFAGSREFELADKIENGTAEPEEVVNKLTEQRDDIFDQNQPLGTSNKAEDLLRRTNDYNERTRQPTEETTEPPSGGDPTPPPAPTPAVDPAASAGADEAAAAAAEDSELAELAVL